MRQILIISSFTILIIYLCELISCKESAINDETKLLKVMVSSSYNHPSQNGYQSVSLGTDKHKYGYEINHEGKHFHHSNTEKDGVRLGCYGHELDGKKYLTRYVADSKGYRLVTNEDLIIVYPKTSQKTGKAVFGVNNDYDDEELFRTRALYTFPKGCKDIDVQIDNSSRLRSLSGTFKNFEISPRLPVNLPNRTNNGDKYTYYKPSIHHPGPSHIYAASNTVPNIYLPPQNTYVPDDNSHISSVDATTTNPTSKNPYFFPINFNEPSKEPTSSCLSYACDVSKGTLVIPIPLKNRNSNDCCSKMAQLILPLKMIDITIVAQLKENVSKEEFNVDQLIRSILENLL